MLFTHVDSVPTAKLFSAAVQYLLTGFKFVILASDTPHSNLATTYHHVSHADFHCELNICCGM